MHSIIKLPTRIDLIRTLPNGASVVEVGVCKGHFSIQILNEAPNVAELVCVDAWKPQPFYSDPMAKYDPADHEANLAECKHVLRGHLPGGRVKIVRGDSLSIADAFYANGDMFDAVYIDAAHDFASVVLDLHVWSRCIKPGGCIMGHDYTENDTAKKWGFGVVEAVDFFCKRFGWKLTHLTKEDFASFRIERA